MKETAIISNGKKNWVVVGWGRKRCLLTAGVHAQAGVPLLAADPLVRVDVAIAPNVAGTLLHKEKRRV